MAKSANSVLLWKSRLAPAAVCAYVIFFALPLEFDFALLLLAVLGTLAVAVNVRQVGRPGLSLHKAIWIFLAAAAVSIVSSSDPRRSFTLGLAILPGVAIFLLVADYFPQRKMLKWVFVAHASVALAIGAGLLATLWRSNWVVQPGYKNWVGELASPIVIVSNDAIFLALAAPLSAAILLTPASRTQKTIATLSVIVTVILTGVMQSRLLATVLILAFAVLAFSIRPRMALPVSLALLALITVLDAAGGFPLYSRFLELRGGASTWWDGRIPIWRASWRMFLEHPLLGEGLHTFRYVSVDNIEVSWAHNLYLETLAEQGIIGFASLLVLLGTLIWTAIWNLKKSVGDDRVTAAALLATTSGLLLGSVFEMSFVRQWVNEIVFFAAGATASLYRFITTRHEAA